MTTSARHCGIIVLTKQFGVLRGHLGIFRKHPDPFAEGRMPSPQIRRNLTPCQTTGLRDPDCIPLERVAVCHCHFRSR
jgi:hypothetical protein